MGSGDVGGARRPRTRHSCLCSIVPATPRGPGPSSSTDPPSPPNALCCGGCIHSSHFLTFLESGSTELPQDLPPYSTHPRHPGQDAPSNYSELEQFNTHCDMLFETLIHPGPDLRSFGLACHPGMACWGVFSVLSRSVSTEQVPQDASHWSQLCFTGTPGVFFW